MRATRLELSSAAQAATLAFQIRQLPGVEAGLREAVAAIVADVRALGDEAVIEYGQRFDATGDGDLRVSRETIDAALVELDDGVRAGLEVAIVNVRAVAVADRASRRQASARLDQGQAVELRDVPVDRVGIYAPGGRAAYPSSVVMCAVPAEVAGVGLRSVVTPPGPAGSPHPVVLAACALCGVEQVYAVGGAQAIAALAYGTNTIDAVDLIAGPGNAYVQEAKRLVFGDVGIDSIAGPSDLVVIADGSTDPDGIALDLAAQAEHGEQSLLVLIADDAELLARVGERVAAIAERHDSVADAALALVVAGDLETAVALSNAIAPEHLELQVADPVAMVAAVTAAGCVFLGAQGGAAFGDYVAGSNHVLPTGGAARFFGPLGVGTFRRRQALVSLPAEAARVLAPHAANVARAEGFPVHAESVEARQRTGR